MVALRMVMLMSLSKLWSAFCRKCLYKGELVFFLMSVLCSVSLLRRGFEVCPINWLPFVHVVHSSR